MFQYVPPAFDQSLNLKVKGYAFILLHQIERIGAEYTATQTKNELVLSEKEDVKSEVFLP